MRCGYDGLMRAEAVPDRSSAGCGRAHRRFFADRTVEVFDGPRRARSRLGCRASPRSACRPPRPASSGPTSRAAFGMPVHIEEHGLEFCLIAPERDHRHALILAMNAYYHANSDVSFRLDVGHTVPLGEPWLPGSLLDHLLVSQPYPYGPEFEMCHWEGGHARILWLLPITESERDSGLNTDSRRSSNASTTRASTTGIRDDRLSPNRRFRARSSSAPRAVCAVPLLAA